MVVGVTGIIKEIRADDNKILVAFNEKVGSGKSKWIHPKDFDKLTFTVNMGKGDRVEVLETFPSNSKRKTTLRKGMKGTILKIDDGDASIKFDDLAGNNQWVFKRNFKLLKNLRDTRPVQGALLKPGTKVMGYWKDQNSRQSGWFPATVKAVNQQERWYFVRFDDGYGDYVVEGEVTTNLATNPDHPNPGPLLDKTLMKKLLQLCWKDGYNSNPLQPDPQVPLPDVLIDTKPFSKGDVVEADWNGKWMVATIISNDEEGTYKIKWQEDGKTSPRFAESKIRKRGFKEGDRVRVVPSSFLESILHPTGATGILEVHFKTKGRDEWGVMLDATVKERVKRRRLKTKDLELIESTKYTMDVVSKKDMANEVVGTMLYRSLLTNGMPSGYKDVYCKDDVWDITMLEQDGADEAILARMVTDYSPAESEAEEVN